mmetsp:Transcript_10318/g.18587  ORF Transcript_10318/g.18587 Transcript_10318/m.18587 type:complete len:135 (-) Transcript_10318:2347-2751(-)
MINSEYSLAFGGFCIPPVSSELVVTAKPSVCSLHRTLLAEAIQTPGSTIAPFQTLFPDQNTKIPSSARSSAVFGSGSVSERSAPKETTFRTRPQETSAINVDPDSDLGRVLFGNSSESAARAKRQIAPRAHSGF